MRSSRSQVTLIGGTVITARPQGQEIRKKVLFNGAGGFETQDNMVVSLNLQSNGIGRHHRPLPLNPECVQSLFLCALSPAATPQRRESTIARLRRIAKIPTNYWQVGVSADSMSIWRELFTKS
jgi:hypothetical protein